MIGLLDLARTGRVARGLDRQRFALRPMADVDETRRRLGAGELEGLVVEATGHESILWPLLTHARDARVPVLVVAARQQVAAAVETLRAGASDYLPSPFDDEALEDALERLLGLCARGSSSRGRFVTRDPELEATLELARSVAASDATVLIQGESGTGKELVARWIHDCSPRHRREMVSVNCAALPAGLLESELFGHERGAFTGAFARVLGKFELADGTTLLLDEIGELELPLQAKLLRVIQEKHVQRVGAPRSLYVDFRLVATTNRDLAESARRGEFREDLYYRLNVVPLRLKPLRERPDDVALLVEHFLRQAPPGTRVPILPPETLEVLARHGWPGNVRELQNLIERLVLMHAGQVVRPGDLRLGPQASSLAGGARAAAPPFRTLREMERWLIVETLARLEGNRTRSARELGISLRTLRNKIHAYRIHEPETLPRGALPRA